MAPTAPSWPPGARQRLLGFTRPGGWGVKPAGITGRVAGSCGSKVDSGRPRLWARPAAGKQLLAAPHSGPSLWSELGLRRVRGLWGFGDSRRHSARAPEHRRGCWAPSGCSRPAASGRPFRGQGPDPSALEGAKDSAPGGLEVTVGPDETGSGHFLNVGCSPLPVRILPTSGARPAPLPW